MAEANSQAARTILNAFMQGTGMLVNNAKNVVQPWLNLAGQAYDKADALYEEYAPNEMKKFLRDYNAMPNMPSPAKGMKALTAADDILDAIPQMGPVTKALATKLPKVTQAANWDSIIEAASKLGPESLKLHDINSPAAYFLKSVSDRYDALRKHMFAQPDGSFIYDNPGTGLHRTLPKTVQYAEYPLNGDLTAAPGFPRDNVLSSIAVTAEEMPYLPNTKLVVTPRPEMSALGHADNAAREQVINNTPARFVSARSTVRGDPNKYWEAGDNSLKSLYRYFLNTFPHESEHFYQYANNPSILDNYVYPSQNFSLYWSHPAEVGARRKAEDVVSAYANHMNSILPDSPEQMNLSLGQLTDFFRTAPSLAKDSSTKVGLLSNLDFLRKQLIDQYGHGIRVADPNTLLDPKYGRQVYNMFSSPEYKTAVTNRYGVRKAGLKTPAEQDKYFLDLLYNAYSIDAQKELRRLVGDSQPR